jgi:ankyrin repeat protein
MHAAIDGNVDAARVLLTHGADPTLQDARGYTALHFAAQEYHARVAVALLDAGAPVDAEDSHGNSPLARAVFSSRGRAELIRLLLERGANKNLKNHHGVSPLELAERIDNYDLLPFLG